MSPQNHTKNACIQFPPFSCSVFPTAITESAYLYVNIFISMYIKSNMKILFYWTKYNIQVNNQEYMECCIASFLATSLAMAIGAIVATALAIIGASVI